MAKHSNDRRRSLKSALALTALLCAAGGFSNAASAQAATAAASGYPNKPIHVILAFPPGGSTDIIMRLIAPEMGKRLNGQQLVLDNRPGAGGNIAMDAVAKSAPDGYTIGLGGAGALGINAVTGQPMPYDAAKDLAPIGLLTSTPFVLVAPPSLPANSVADLIALGKSGKQTLAIGHGGNGTVMQLNTELFKQMSGINAVAVPYKGTAPATLDAVGGQVPLAMSDVPSAIQFVKSGKLKAIAVSTAKRSEAMPDVPTMAESGLKGYDSTGWFGLVAPAGTPPAIIRRLNTELNAVLNDPAIKARMVAYGAEPAPVSPEQLSELMRHDVDQWSKLIKTANIKFD